MWMSVIVVLYGVLFVHFRTSNKHYLQYTHNTKSAQNICAATTCFPFILFTRLNVPFFPILIRIVHIFLRLKKKRTKWKEKKKKKKNTPTKPIANRMLERHFHGRVFPSIHLLHVILSFLLSSCVNVFIYFIPFILVQSHCLPAPLFVLPFRNTIFNMTPIENRTEYPCWCTRCFQWTRQAGRP